MKHCIMMGLVVALFCAGGCADSNAPQKAAAVKAAEAALTVIDNKQYGKSWNEAAGFFKGAVTKDQWVGAMNSIRKPLGKMISRKVLSKKYMTEVPGAPDGEYVVIQFKTEFENKKNTIETFTPMLGKDGKWRMSGYFIK